MKLESMNLKHFRCIEELEVNFNPKLTVLVGVNGSGKTSIIDAASIFLKYILPINIMLYSGTTRNDYFSKTDMKNGYTESNMEYVFCINEKKYDIELCFKKMELGNIKYNISKDIGSIKDIINKQETMPIFACYGAKRIINNYERQKDSRTEQKFAFENAFDAQIDFSSTLTWFIEKASQEALEAVGRRNLKHRIPELSAVRAAVAEALGNYNEPFVGDTPPRLFITHKAAPNMHLTLEQLSDGYRTMLALVMDLARRMAVANGHLYWQSEKNVLHSHGIVLIDEIELHLHPSWQQTILPTLMKIFPNLQFIVTTHSPQVLTSIEPKYIQLLYNDMIRSVASSTYGAEASRVLEEVLGVTQRPQNAESRKILDAYFKLVEEGKYYSKKAKEYRNQLEVWLHDDPMLDMADMHIQRAERKKARGRHHA